MNQYDITFIGCDNIFKNVVIKLGKTKEKIIKSQIEHLNSDNYCISKHKKIQENDTVVIIFHEGFINMDVSFTVDALINQR